MHGTARTRIGMVALGALLAACAVALLLPHPARPAAAPGAKPNLLVVMTDDQTLESMRVMPNVKRLLADQGTTFDNSFVSFSLCCPSRSTFLTGQYAHNHGVMGNGPPEGGYGKLDKSNYLPLWLQSAGYKTMEVGKFLNGYGVRNPKTEVPPGWDEWHALVDPTTYNYYGYTLNENGHLNTYGARGNPAFYSTDFFTRLAQQLIVKSAPSPQPFFLFTAFVAPHSGHPADDDDPKNIPTPVPAPRQKNHFSSEPLPQPPGFNEPDVSDKPRFIRRKPRMSPDRIAQVRENYQQRLESLLAVDEGVTQIVATLQATGELDNTLIVFTSDNGFFHGEHRIQYGKIFLYEPSIRVPLVMRGPGVPSGVHRSQLVTNPDVTATLLHAASAQARRELDGRSLFAFMSDPGLEPGRALLEETPGYSAIRTYRYIYAEHRNGDRELYDLLRDPFERVSRHNDRRYDSVRADLARGLANLRNCHGAGCQGHPQVGLRLRPSNCVRDKVRVRVTGPAERRVIRAEFRVGGRVLASDAHHPFVKDLRVRVAHGRQAHLRVRTVFLDGRLMTLDRQLRGC